MSKPVKPTAERSPVRRERARATRRRIREAAARLFVEHGYMATTIEAIAVEAGVAVQTVYFVFGNKRAMPAEALDVATAGGDAPVPVAERAWVEELRREDDPRRIVGAIAREGCA